jgi:hypothetical protein
MFAASGLSKTWSSGELLSVSGDSDMSYAPTAEFGIPIAS